MFGPSAISEPSSFLQRQLLYRGTIIHCPLCKSGLSRYVKHGQDFEVLKRRKVVGGVALHDYCPVCFSLSRTRLIQLYLERSLRTDWLRLRALHFAPELGLANWIAQQQPVFYVACDRSSHSYPEISGMIRSSLEQLPFRSGSFDLLICSHVLEHVKDDRAAMSELYRVLRVGGEALCMVPEARDGRGTDDAEAELPKDERERRFGQNDHWRLYDGEDFTRRLTACGFVVRAFDAFVEEPNLAIRRDVNPLERLRVARKA